MLEFHIQVSLQFPLNPGNMSGLYDGTDLMIRALLSRVLTNLWNPTSCTHTTIHQNQQVPLLLLWEHCYRKHGLSRLREINILSLCQSQPFCLKLCGQFQTVGCKQGNQWDVVKVKREQPPSSLLLYVINSFLICATHRHIIRVIICLRYGTTASHLAHRWINQSPWPVLIFAKI